MKQLFVFVLEILVSFSGNLCFKTIILGLTIVPELVIVFRPHESILIFSFHSHSGLEGFGLASCYMFISFYVERPSSHK